MKIVLYVRIDDMNDLTKKLASHATLIIEIGQKTGEVLDNKKFMV